MATKGSAADYMATVTEIVGRLPEWERVDIEAWDNEPTFRVRNKNFVFASKNAQYLSFKLSKEEAEAVVNSDENVDYMGYGLGRHGWVSLSIRRKPSKARWAEIEEWIRTSYTNVAPKTLAKQVLEADGLL